MITSLVPWPVRIPRGLSVAVLLSTLPGVAASQGQTGTFCVRDFQPLAACTANDVRIGSLSVISAIEDCLSGVSGEAELVLQIMATSEGAPDRYDIGLRVHSEPSVLWHHHSIAIFTAL